MATVQLKSVSRSYSRKVSYREADGTLVSVEAPLWVSVDVTPDAMDVDIEKLIQRIGIRLHEILRQAVLTDLISELPVPEREKLRALLARERV